MAKWRAAASDEIGSAILAVLIVVLHTAVSAAIICCMWLMEQLIRALWTQEPIIAGVPLHTIMLGAEVIVLIVFLSAATIKAALAFWR
jgi:hypothetical protein